MQAVFNSFSVASSQALQLWNRVSVKETPSHLIQFWNQHGAAISDIALFAGDFYSLLEAPVTLITTFLVTTGLSDEIINQAALKAKKIWEQQPKAKPLIVGGAVIVSAWQPQKALAAICGFYSADRMKSMISAST